MPAAATLPADDPHESGLPRHEVQVGIQADAAAQLGIRPGDVAALALTTFGPVDVVVTGTYTVDDPSDRVWTGFADLLAPRDAASGTGSHAALLVTGASLPDVELVVQPRALVTQLRYSPDPSLVDAASSGAIRAVITQVQADPSALNRAAAGPTTVTTTLGSALDAVGGRLAAARAQQSVLVLGLAGVGALVLVLAARLLVARREPFLLAERARGASVASVLVRALLESVPIARRRGLRRCPDGVAGAARRRQPVGRHRGPRRRGRPHAGRRRRTARADGVRRAADAREPRRPRPRAPTSPRPPGRRRVGVVPGRGRRASSPFAGAVSRRPHRRRRPAAGGDAAARSRRRRRSSLARSCRPCCARSAGRRRRRGAGPGRRDRPGERRRRYRGPAADADGRRRARRVLRDDRAHGPGRPARRRRPGVGADVRVEGTLTEQDVTALRAQPGVTAVAGLAVLGGRALGQDCGTTVDLLLVDADQLAAIAAAHGRPAAGLRRLTTATGDSRRPRHPALATDRRARAAAVLAHSGALTSTSSAPAGDEPRRAATDTAGTDGRVLVDRARFDAAQAATTDSNVLSTARARSPRPRRCTWRTARASP